MSEQKPHVSFMLMEPNAVVPKKGTLYAVGYDLTAISVFKRVSDRIVLYDTGVKVCPQPGYYLEILPRSSLAKTGYVLANSVGVIDPDYSDRLLIALIKVDEKAPELELPFTRCQLVLRKQEMFDMVQVKSITETGRGSFGSTDQGKADQGKADQGKADQGKADQGKADGTDQGK